ncbi:MAG: AsmA-like C-terminal domain-containing protein [Hydrogenimonas sp.]|nr:AsmA-like C-terminal domain-containing protein [Hydrogenimonas sp.]
MIITTTKLIHSTILKIFLLLSLAVITLFFALTSGFTIPNISLPGVNISQFYIKLDKKLEISIERVEIEKENSPAKTAGEVERVGTLIQYLPNYFSRVYIKNLIVGKRAFHLLYSDNTFYFDTDTLQIASKISYDPSKKILDADVRKLLIKDPGIDLLGRFQYDFREKIWRGEGSYNGFGMHGDFNISHERDYVSFEIDSDPCSSIKPLVDYIDPPEDIKVWIYPKIPAKRYLLHYMRGGFFLKKDGSIDFDPKELEAFATAFDAQIHFHKDLPPVTTPQIDVTLKKDTLSFKLYSPRYEGKKLVGSSVQIRDLTNAKAELDAHIVLKDKVDDSIRELLGAYGIDLPFVQTEGVTDAVVDFSVKLVDGKVTRYRGDYRSKYTKLLFDNVVPLPVKNLHVVSRNATIDVKPCKIEFAPYLDANLSGTIDLHKREGSFDVIVNSLSYSYKDIPIFEMNDTNVKVLLNFAKDVDFRIPTLDTDIIYKKGGGLHVETADLKSVKPYLQGPLKPIESGSIEVDYKKPGFKAQGRVKYPNNILSLNASGIDEFEIFAESKENQTHIRVNDSISIVAQRDRTFFNIKKIDIDADALLNFIKPYIKGREENKKSSSQHLLYIEGHDSKIRYKKIELPCKFYNLRVETDPLILKFETMHDKGEIRGVVENKNINIAGKSLSDRTIKSLTTLNQLKGGSFDFNAIGTLDDFNGTILMRDTLWAETAFYNNLLATLNTIPAILTLKNPGFSKSGFKIKRGAIDYRYKDERLFFKKIVIEGYSAQITGQGSLDFNTGMVAMKLQIHFMESLTNVLSKIPIAGYIIFGDDGTLAVTLKIKGAMENPKVETEATKDLIKAPLNILERTLTLPFKIFE